MDAARLREQQIKRWSRKKKEALIEGDILVEHLFDDIEQLGYVTCSTFQEKGVYPIIKIFFECHSSTCVPSC